MSWTIGKSYKRWVQALGNYHVTGKRAGTLEGYLGGMVLSSVSYCPLMLPSLGFAVTVCSSPTPLLSFLIPSATKC